MRSSLHGSGLLNCLWPASCITKMMTEKRQDRWRTLIHTLHFDSRSRYERAMLVTWTIIIRGAEHSLRELSEGHFRYTARASTSLTDSLTH